VKRVVASLAVVVLVASIGTAVLIWRLHSPPEQPEVSMYSQGRLTKVRPSLDCDVLNPTICRPSNEEGELPVTDRHPVQLSVPAAIAKAPWWLVLVYDNPVDTTLGRYRPDTRLAVTIPTVDPARGRLRQIVVQLRTLVRDQAGDEFPVPHAEWSVRTVWPQPAP
jgi:hypothetical protein